MKFYMVIVLLIFFNITYGQNHPYQETVKFDSTILVDTGDMRINFYPHSLLPDTLDGYAQIIQNDGMFGMRLDFRKVKKIQILKRRSKLLEDILKYYNHKKMIFVLRQRQNLHNEDRLLQDP